MQLNKILRYVLLAGIFLIPFIPLIVARDMFFPFITGKSFVFRILVEFLFGAWIILAWRDASYRPRFSWILAALAAFLGVITLADLFGENPYRSFWSNYERMEGLITHIHLFAYFLITTSVLLTQKLWQRFLNTSLGVSVILAFYGIFQLLGFIVINQGGVRIDATFSNASFFAAYVLFHIFLAALFALRENQSQFLRLLYGGIFLLNVFILYSTATRGAILGFIVGALLTAFLIALFEKRRKLIRKFAFVSISVIVITVAVFIFLRNTQFVYEHPVLTRFTYISLQKIKTEPRAVVWNIAFKGFKEHPLLGWGQENFTLVFDKYYDPRLYEREGWFDRAHNIVFEWLIAGGIAGLLAYLSIFGAALYYLWFRFSRFSLIQKSILTGLLVGYFSHNLFTLDTITSYLLFFSVLGYIHTGFLEIDEAREFEKSRRGGEKSIIPQYVLISFVVAMSIFVIYLFNAKALLANFSLRQGLAPHPEGISTNLTYFKQALAYDAFGVSETREQLVHFANNLVGTDASPTITQDVFNLAHQQMLFEVEEESQNVRKLFLLGVLLAEYKMYDEALEYLEKARTLSPRKQYIYFELGYTLLDKKEYEQALEAFRTAYELAPQSRSARKLYAAALIYAGEEKEGEALLRAAFDTALIPDPVFINAYASRGDFRTVATLWEMRIAQEPDNIQFRLSLVATYLEVGERLKAIDEIKRAIELDPQFKEQGEYYIQEIQAGRKLPIVSN